MQRDQAGYVDGLDFYLFAGSSPTNQTDALGLDGTTPSQLGWEWLTGTGPEKRYFGQDDPMTQMLRNHRHLEVVREDIKSKLTQRCKKCQKGSLADSQSYSLKGAEGVYNYFADAYAAVAEGNTAPFFLGSYDLKYDVYYVHCCRGFAIVKFKATNPTTLASGTRPPVLGYTKWYKRNVEPIINGLPSQGGPMSEKDQIIEWEEQLGFPGNRCCCSKEIPVLPAGSDPQIPRSEAYIW